MTDHGFAVSLPLVEVSHDGINELPALLLPENIILNIVVDI